MKRFSVIIPCYNSYNLMQKCLNSLENQTMKDFEVIVIDDSSTDDSYAKLIEYKNKTKMSLIVEETPHNVGPGEARNIGIEKANSEYIFMLDADDYIELNTLQIINEIIESKKVDCIFFDYYIETNGKISKRTSIPSFEEGYMEKSDAIIFSNGSTLGKIYKLDVIKKNQIKYPALKRNEDMPFNKIAISNCSKFYYLKSNLYYYVMNKNSLMHDSKLLDENNAIRAFDYIRKSIEKNFPVEVEAIFIKEYLYSTTMTLLQKENTKKQIKEHIKKSSKMYPNWYKNESIKKYPNHLKLCLFFIKHKNIMLLKLMILLKKVLSK